MEAKVEEVGKKVNYEFSTFDITELVFLVLVKNG